MNASSRIPPMSPARPCAALLSAATLAVTLPLLACATPAAASRSARVGPFEVEILVDGRPQRVYSHRGRFFVAGSEGRRYEIRVLNHSDRRIEAVVSVDGRDVVDGRPASVGRRGYLVAPRSSVTIDGFRVSLEEVAAFRFSSVRDSYAARMGDATNVGVIGVAVFQERPLPEFPPPPPVLSANPYGEEVVDDGGDSGWRGAPSRGARAEAPPAASASPAPAAADGAAGPSGGGAAIHQEARRGTAKGRRADRPGLGTAFGERRASPVREVPFEREDPDTPTAVITLRYDDREGLEAAGVIPRPDPRELEARRRAQANPFPADDRFAIPPAGWVR